ncbi:hypothetical protein [Citricoccus sp. I39-566]|uniref:hypothetical protein n=1 Tax=Citricoccus sp. I39-566 TaxID=3073268 RepID=UPI00286D5341|nr:hypothetical protein [Citricoccus sp. I39-566]WMY78461.1 hypothetical protein RE421_00955 [Citricoccus sp. I39-566]
MSTPLSFSLPETTSVAGASATTEQVTFWTVLSVVSAAAAAGILEVVLHLAG